MTTTPTDPATASFTLAELGDQMLELFCERDPFRAEGFGFPGVAERLTPRDDDSRLRHVDRYRQLSDRATALPADRLDEQERLTRLTLIEQATSAAEYLAADPYPVTVNLSREFSASGVVRSLTKSKITTADQADAYLARLHVLPEFLRTDLELRRRGIAESRPGLDSSLRSEVAELEARLATDPGQDQLATLTVTGDWDQATWRSKVLATVRDVVHPAVRELVAGLQAQVLAQARPDERAGLCWVAGGEELYRACIREETSLPGDPQELHALALRMWEAAAERMRPLGRQLFGTEELATVLDRLRTDTALAYGSAEQVLAAARTEMEQLMAQCDRWFGIAPLTDCLVEEMPAATALRYPSGQYKSGTLDGTRPGRFLINTTQPRYRHEVPAMLRGGGVPGTHVYWNYAMRATIPTFRKVAPMHGFVKGWCGYALDLGSEFAVEVDALGELGLWAKRAANASRLAVDTGVHALGWSRDKAIRYRLDTCGTSERDAVVDVDRILGIPGEGGVWCVGGEQIRRCREASMARAGGGWDARRFHDALLAGGAVPLGALAEITARA